MYLASWNDNPIPNRFLSHIHVDCSKIPAQDCKQTEAKPEIVIRFSRMRRISWMPRPGGWICYFKTKQKKIAHLHCFPQGATIFSRNQINLAVWVKKNPPLSWQFTPNSRRHFFVFCKLCIEIRPWIMTWWSFSLSFVILTKKMRKSPSMTIQQTRNVFEEHWKFQACFVFV